MSSCRVMLMEKDHERGRPARQSLDDVKEWTGMSMWSGERVSVVLTPTHTEWSMGFDIRQIIYLAFKKIFKKPNASE